MEKNKKTKNNITNIFLRILKNRNILVFLFFFALAAFLWFLNALNKEYSTIIKIPYKIENTPKNLRLEKDIAPELKINIYGHGYSILKQKIESIKLPVIIDFNNKQNSIVLHKENNSTKSFILTNDLIPNISKRFGDNLQITEISPDTIYFHLYDGSSKTLPIIPDIDYTMHAEYMLHGKYKLSPDSVVVHGHRNVLDTINSIKTTHTNLGIIGENNEKTLELMPQPYLEYSIKNVTIKMPTEKFTETYKDINIKPINFPENFDHVILPDKIQVFYKTPLSLYNSITENNFEAYADYNKQKNDIIEIDITSTNPNIEILRINPISITYFLEKRTPND
jgi:hypothetical protein